MPKYISKYSQLRLVNKSSYTKEVEGRVIAVPGNSIRFEEGVYETEKEEEINFLENHPNFGSIFIRLNEGKDAKREAKNLNKDLETKEKEKSAKESTEKKEDKKLKVEDNPKNKKNGKTEGAAEGAGAEENSEEKEPAF